MKEKIEIQDMSKLEITKNQLLTQIKKALNSSGYYTISTCNALNWNLTEHLAMHDLHRNTPEGLHITFKVNFEVSDWVVTVK